MDPVTQSIVGSRTLPPAGAFDHWQAAPLRITLTLASGVNISGAVSIVAEIHDSQGTASDTPLASIETTPVSDTDGPWTLDFTGPQLNQTIAAGRDKRSLWLVIVATYAADRIEVLATRTITLHRNAYSGAVADPPAAVTYLTAAAAATLYYTKAEVDTLIAEGGGGSGSTNLTFDRDDTTVTVISSSGTDATLPAATGSLAGVMAAADKTKLTGIADNATANSADATLLARANHTGTQAISTITGLQTILDGSTGGNSTSDSGKLAKFDAAGGLRAEAMTVDTNLIIGSGTITNTGGNNVIVGSGSTISGTLGYNLSYGANNAINGNGGFGFVWAFGNDYNFRTENVFGARGAYLLVGYLHQGLGEDGIAVGFHNRVAGRGCIDFSSTEAMATGTITDGLGGACMSNFGAGLGVYRGFCVTIGGHHNLDGQQTLGDVSARSSSAGVCPGSGTGGGIHTANLVISTVQDVRLVLLPNTLYVFRFCITAGFITVVECAATWEYTVTVHQGAAGTTPLIRSVVLEGLPRGSGPSGAVPDGWSIAFTAATQELVPVLTLKNPNATAAGWTATGSFRCTETSARYDGGGGTTAERTMATQEWATSAFAASSHNHDADAITTGTLNIGRLPASYGGDESADADKVAKFGAAGELHMSGWRVTDANGYLSADTAGQFSRKEAGWTDPGLLNWPTDIGDGDTGEIATRAWATANLGGGGGGGAKSIYIPAAAMVPRTTNGCGVNSSELSTNKINFDTLDFDTAVAAGSEERAQFLTVLPDNWNAGTVTAKFHWTADGGSGGVVWALSARSLADDGALDTAMGTAQQVADTLLAANDMHTTAATSAITIGGTPAVGDPVMWEVCRKNNDASDTLAVDARLLGITLTYQ